MYTYTYILWRETTENIPTDSNAHTYNEEECDTATHAQREGYQRSRKNACIVSGHS